MTERELERTTEADESENSDSDRRDAHETESDFDGRDPSREYDQSADSFLDLEAAVSPESLSDSETYAQIVGTDRVSASAVPDSYPWSIATADALALDLEIDDRGTEVTVYFEWPVPDSDARLSRLLGTLEVSPDAVADLHGKQVLVERADGHWVPVVPPQQSAGSPLGFYGLLGGVLFNVTVLTAFVLNLGVSEGLLLSLFMVFNLLVLPVSTFLDAGYLRSHTDWGGPFSRWGWTILNAAPGLNAVTALCYLSLRRRASWIRKR
ncbi:hypothetical protein [Halostagnicola kamekurae]|nr:hypothetical protein [Halostagnicola kamekurae]